MANVNANVPNGANQNPKAPWGQKEKDENLVCQECMFPVLADENFEVVYCDNCEVKTLAKDKNELLHEQYLSVLDGVNYTKK